MDIREIVENFEPEDAMERIRRLARNLAQKGVLEKLILQEPTLDEKGCKALSHEVLDIFKKSSDSLKDMIISIEGLLQWRDLLSKDPSVPLSWLLQLSLKASELVRFRHTMAKCFDLLTTTTLQYLPVRVIMERHELSGENERLKERVAELTRSNVQGQVYHSLWQSKRAALRWYDMAMRLRMKRNEDRMHALLNARVREIVTLRNNVRYHLSRQAQAQTMATRLISDLKREKDELERARRGLLKQPAILIGNPDQKVHQRLQLESGPASEEIRMKQTLSKLDEGIAANKHADERLGLIAQVAMMEGKVEKAINFLTDDKGLEALVLGQVASNGGQYRGKAKVDSRRGKKKAARPSTAPAAASPTKGQRQDPAKRGEDGLDGLSGWDHGPGPTDPSLPQVGGSARSRSPTAGALHAVPEEKSFVQAHPEDHAPGSEALETQLVDLDSFFVGGYAPFSAPAAAGRRTPLYSGGSRGATGSSMEGVYETEEDFASALDRMVWEATRRTADSDVTFRGTVSPRAEIRSQPEAGDAGHGVRTGGWGSTMSLRAGTAPEGARRYNNEFHRSVTFGATSASDDEGITRAQSGASAGSGPSSSALGQGQRTRRSGTDPTRPTLHAIPSQGPLEGTEAPEDVGSVLSGEEEDGDSDRPPSQLPSPSRQTSGWKGQAAVDSTQVNWREPIYRKRLGIDEVKAIPAELDYDDSKDKLPEHVLSRITAGMEAPVQAAKEARSSIIKVVTQRELEEDEGEPLTSPSRDQAGFPPSILRGTSNWQDAALPPSAEVRPAWNAGRAGKLTPSKSNASQRLGAPEVGGSSLPAGAVDPREVRQVEHEVLDEMRRADEELVGLPLSRVGSDFVPTTPAGKRRLLTDHELMAIYGERITSIIDEATIKLKLEHQSQIESMEKLFELRLVEVNSAWSKRVKTLEKDVRDLLKKMQVVRPQSGNVARDNYRFRSQTPQMALESNIERLDNLLMGQGFQEAPDQLFETLELLRRADVEDRVHHEQVMGSREGSTSGTRASFGTSGALLLPQRRAEPEDSMTDERPATLPSDWQQMDVGGGWKVVTPPPTAPAQGAEAGGDLTPAPWEAASRSPRDVSSQDRSRRGSHVDFSARTAKTPKSEAVMARIQRNLNSGVGRVVQEEHKRRGSVLLAEDQAISMDGLEDLASKVAAREGRQRHNSVTVGSDIPDYASAAQEAAAFFYAEGGQRSPSEPGSARDSNPGSGASPSTFARAAQERVRPRSRFASEVHRSGSEGGEGPSSPFESPARERPSGQEGPAPEASFQSHAAEGELNPTRPAGRHVSPDRTFAFATASVSTTTPSRLSPDRQRTEQSATMPHMRRSPKREVGPWGSSIPSHLTIAVPGEPEPQSASKAAGFAQDPPPAPTASTPSAKHRPPAGPSSVARGQDSASTSQFIYNTNARTTTPTAVASAAAATAASASAPSTRAASASPAHPPNRPASALMVKQVFTSESVLAPTMASLRPATATANLARTGAHIIQGVVFQAFTPEVARTAKPPIDEKSRPRSGYKGDGTSPVPSYYAVREQQPFKTHAFVYPSAPAAAEKGLPGKKLSTKNMLQSSSTAFIKPSPMTGVPLRPGSAAKPASAGPAGFLTSSAPRGAALGVGGGKDVAAPGGKTGPGGASAAGTKWAF